MIRAYQFLLSPILGENCRHIPTCSQYSVQAIKEWGSLKGLWISLKRIFRCNPWGTKGYDPIPNKDH
tara:strand:- start:395 stop:595 length:201 start_codon:yes stop_codon:yes gene_type:complete